MSPNDATEQGDRSGDRSGTKILHDVRNLMTSLMAHSRRVHLALQAEPSIGPELRAQANELHRLVLEAGRVAGSVRPDGPQLHGALSDYLTHHSDAVGQKLPTPRDVKVVERDLGEVEEFVDPIVVLGLVMAMVRALDRHGRPGASVELLLEGPERVGHHRDDHRDDLGSFGLTASTAAQPGAAVREHDPATQALDRMTTRVEGEWHTLRPTEATVAIRVTLPLGPAVALQRQPPRAARLTGVHPSNETAAGEVPAELHPRLRILLVDDSATVRRAVASQLTHLGYRVTEAGSGEEAYEILQSGSAATQLMIVDESMGGMSGSDLIRQLRAEGSELRTILLSGAPVQGSEIVADGFLMKPPRLASIQSAIESAMLPRSGGHAATPPR